MKVLYISYPPFFDLELSLIKHLSKYCDVTYLLDISWFHYKSSALDIKKGHPESGIYSSEIYPEFSVFRDFITTENFFVVNRTEQKTFSVSNILLQKEISKFIKKINPDVIHFGTFPTLNFLFPLLKNRHKSVLTVHDPRPHIGENFQQKTRLRYLSFRLIKNIILLNREQYPSFIEENLKYKFKHVFLSSLGIYEYLRIYPVEASNLNGKFNFLFFGRISPYKGIDLLLEAFEFIQKENVILTIAGNGSFWFDKSKYEKDMNVQFINRYIPNDELVTLINSADIIVCPYIEATQSGVIMSAFALNKPVIATKTGNLASIIKNGYNGYLIEPNSVQEIKDIFSYVINHKNEISQLSENIKYDNSNGDNSWDKISLCLFEDYKKIKKER